MYKCNRCGAEFETPKRIKNGGGDVGEDWPVCPECRNDDYDEARECTMCGVVKRDVHMCSGVNVCLDCMRGIAAKAESVLTNGLSAAERKAFREYYGLGEKIY